MSIWFLRWWKPRPRGGGECLGCVDGGMGPTIDSRGSEEEEEGVGEGERVLECWWVEWDDRAFPFLLAGGEVVLEGEGLDEALRLWVLRCLRSLSPSCRRLRCRSVLDVADSERRLLRWRFLSSGLEDLLLPR